RTRQGEGPAASGRGAHLRAAPGTAIQLRRTRRDAGGGRLRRERVRDARAAAADRRAGSRRAAPRSGRGAADRAGGRALRVHVCGVRIRSRQPYRSATRYQSIAFRSLKNPPVGPFAGSAASPTIVSAPSSTDCVAPGPPMSVRTQPGHALLTRTPAPFVAAASCRVNALSALFDIEYAGAYVPIE